MKIISKYKLTAIFFIVNTSFLYLPNAFSGTSQYYTIMSGDDYFSNPKACKIFDAPSKLRVIGLDELSKQWLSSNVWAVATAFKRTVAFRIHFDNRGISNISPEVQIKPQKKRRTIVLCATDYTLSSPLSKLMVNYKKIMTARLIQQMSKAKTENISKENESHRKKTNPSSAGSNILTKVGDVVTGGWYGEIDEKSFELALWPIVGSRQWHGFMYSSSSPSGCILEIILSVAEDETSADLNTISWMLVGGCKNTAKSTQHVDYTSKGIIDMEKLPSSLSLKLLPSSSSAFVFTRKGVSDNFLKTIVTFNHPVIPTPSTKMLAQLISSHSFVDSKSKKKSSKNIENINAKLKQFKDEEKVEKERSIAMQQAKIRKQNEERKKYELKKQKKFNDNIITNGKFKDFTLLMQGTITKTKVGSGRFEKLINESRIFKIFKMPEALFEKDARHTYNYVFYDTVTQCAVPINAEKFIGGDKTFLKMRLGPYKKGLYAKWNTKTKNSKYYNKQLAEIDLICQENTGQRSYAWAGKTIFMRKNKNKVNVFIPSPRDHTLRSDRGHGELKVVGYLGRFFKYTTSRMIDNPEGMYLVNYVGIRFIKTRIIDGGQYGIDLFGHDKSLTYKKRTEWGWWNPAYQKILYRTFSQGSVSKCGSIDMKFDINYSFTSQKNSVLGKDVLTSFGNGGNICLIVAVNNKTCKPVNCGFWSEQLTDTDNLRGYLVNNLDDAVTIHKSIPKFDFIKERKKWLKSFYSN